MGFVARTLQREGGPSVLGRATSPSTTSTSFSSERPVLKSGISVVA